MNALKCNLKSISFTSQSFPSILWCSGKKLLSKSFFNEVFLPFSVTAFPFSISCKGKIKTIRYSIDRFLIQKLIPAQFPPIEGKSNCFFNRQMLPTSLKIRNFMFVSPRYFFIKWKDYWYERFLER